jgi:exopolysaccharide biosynthesis polyprenyl glycosylphosphotransferase
MEPRGGDGGSGRRAPAERNGSGERRQPSVSRPALSTRSLSADAGPAQPLVELLLDREPWWKRPVDVAGASVALLLLSPLMLAAGLAVSFSSPGPVFYSSWRVGKGGRKFRFHKFRTMCADAERKKQELLAHNEVSGPVFKMSRDPRVTPIGRLLRKTSIDELPQFWNVLVGDMSIVGPRPERPFFVEQFKHRIPSYMLRHKVKAGITGWAQVNGWRGNTSLEKRIEFDLYYIENWSLALDFKIMWLTVIRGLHKAA